MKKSILVAALLAMASVSAFATPGKDPASGLNGGVSVSTTGTTVSGSYVSGNGSSNEWANSTSYGHSTLTVSHSGDVDGDDGFSKGVTISTDTGSHTQTTAGGAVTGGNPGITTADGKTTIYNGAIGFGSTTNTAGGSILFGEGGVQPVGSIPAVTQ